MASYILAKYIVEANNSNPRIMKRNDDGTYTIIGFATGEHNLQNIIELVDNANKIILISNDPSLEDLKG